MTKLREVLKDKNNNLCKQYKSSVISGSKMFKKCYICKNEKSCDNFGKLSSSSDGFKYDCKECRKEYNLKNSEMIKNKNHEYYISKKNELLEKSKIYRKENIESIKQQRKNYRNREEVKNHIKQKQREYLPIRKNKIKEKRVTDLNFRISEILRSKIHKMLSNRNTTYQRYIGCDINYLKKWIEFRFDKNMNWNNFGEYWQIDHILPINKFNFSEEKNIQICFHWTNLQPLSSLENKQKSDKLLLHHYFNNIININRFNKTHTEYLGYQAVNESLRWLRIELRYGNNPMYEDVKTSEIDNPQPSL